MIGLPVEIGSFLLTPLLSAGRLHFAVLINIAQGWLNVSENLPSSSSRDDRNGLGQSHKLFLPLLLSATVIGH